MQINGIICIICIKGRFYETPLDDQVRSDKQDGDKGRGMRRMWSPRAWGGGGRGEKGRV